jgi:hypothetical protein
MFVPLEAAAAALASVLLVAAAERVPAFKVEAHCRFVASRVGSADDFQTCMQDERKARAALLRQWDTFARDDKSHCLRLSTAGLDPTYTELLTCLELQRDARLVRQRDKEHRRGPGQSGR